jgi:hypothetical protein
MLSSHCGFDSHMCDANSLRAPLSTEFRHLTVVRETRVVDGRHGRRRTTRIEFPAAPPLIRRADFTIGHSEPEFKCSGSGSAKRSRRIDEVFKSIPDRHAVAAGIRTAGANIRIRIDHYAMCVTGQFVPIAPTIKGVSTPL